jgi:hypothetical protein
MPGSAIILQTDIMQKLNVSLTVIARKKGIQL